ncbi:MAG: HAMP domain-containing sensor histidine kinase [Candidatus Micrarchaeia archaeon]
MNSTYKSLELRRVAAPLNKVNLNDVEKQSIPFLRRKSDSKVFSKTVKAEDIITKEELDRLKEDIARKEEATKMKIERLRKEFSSYQMEMDVELLFKDNTINELKTEVAKLKEKITDMQQTIILQKEMIEKQKQIINEQTTEYMKHLNDLLSEKKKSDQEYSKSLARTVHDMKNPLTGVKSGIEVLLEYEDLGEDKRQILNLVYNSAIDLSRMIEEILLNNKFLHNAIELKKNGFNLSRRIQQIVEVHKLHAERTNKKMFLSGNENLAITGDEDKIRRAIENIILNALKYSKQEVRIELAEGEKEIHVSISDDGEGFNDDVKRKVLSNKDMATTDLINGNGFGLTNAKRIIEMHGGKIAIASKEGNGTTVRITLPK